MLRRNEAPIGELLLAEYKTFFRCLAETQFDILSFPSDMVVSVKHSRTVMWDTQYVQRIENIWELQYLSVNMCTQFAIAVRTYCIVQEKLAADVLRNNMLTIEMNILICASTEDANRLEVRVVIHLGQLFVASPR